MALSFHRYLKKLLIDVFSHPEFTPEKIAQKLQKVARRPCHKEDSERFDAWIRLKGIAGIVHFTPLDNVPFILKYGLMPRDYLQLEVVNLALGSKFTDNFRLDGRAEYNCLSFTSPNYKMFYSKRNKLKDTRWAVIVFDPIVLRRLFFLFTPTNSASGCATLEGVSGAEASFTLPELRENLGISSCEPTDPQAELLCDSIIDPESIIGIYVDNHHDLDWLMHRDVLAEINNNMFQPRRDSKFWKKRKITNIQKDWKSTRSMEI